VVIASIHITKLSAELTLAKTTSSGQIMRNDVRRVMGQRQRQWRRRMDRHRLWFDRDLRSNHRRLKVGILSYIRQGRLLNVVTAPVLYSLIVPLAILDLWIAIYQVVCFPILGIAPVARRRYFAMDRRKLAYLNGIEKLNCTYCSYANGLFAYVREVAGRTEQYWCPIKHARRIPGPHRRYDRYFEYGDAVAYRSGLTAMRDELRPAQMRSPRHVPRRR
jgi:hypothetical protein